MSKAPRPRLARVAEQIQRILSEALFRECFDSRFKLMSVTRVSLSNDLSHAKVYMSLLCPLEEVEEYMALLESEKGRLRSYVAKHGHYRKSPNLRFIHDDSTINSQKIASLLEEALPKHDKKDDCDR